MGRAGETGIRNTGGRLALESGAAYKDSALFIRLPTAAPTADVAVADFLDA